MTHPRSCGAWFWEQRRFDSAARLETAPSSSGQDAGLSSRRRRVRFPPGLPRTRSASFSRIRLVAEDIRFSVGKRGFNSPMRDRPGVRQRQTACLGRMQTEVRVLSPGLPGCGATEAHRSGGPRAVGSTPAIPTMQRHRHRANLERYHTRRGLVRGPARGGRCASSECSSAW